MKDYTTKVELAAIPIVAVIGIIGVVLALAANWGVWAWVIVGIVGLVALLLVFWVYARRNPHPAVHQSPAPTPASTEETAAGYRVLVIADESLVDPSFAEEISGHARGKEVEALVIAPAIGSWLQRWTGDEGAHKDAEQHLGDTVGALAKAGIAARGETGADDPLQAADDGMREFPANEIVFVTRPGTNTDWVERGVIEAARDRYAVPVVHITVD